MIRLVSDVHGAAAALRRVVAAGGGPLLVLGDLINFIDYRTNEGIVATVSGIDLVAEFVRRRSVGDADGARRLWREYTAGREAEIQRRYDEVVVAAYAEVCPALEGGEVYVTYGNVDRPDVLREHLPAGARFLDGEIIELEGLRIGMVGGGLQRIGTAGEVSDDEMARKLDALGPVDVLCTHVAPAIPELATDVVGGREKGSVPVLEYLHSRQPAFHYFGDVHQPRATTWRLGRTRCRNVGYFRATGRAIRHE